ncbi:MAG: outer membrane lipoprotein-sorting protein [Deltaproteobacteria bacterium]|nr:outer membrane lipoprotein-sorting protein [Deltaproteobacteria bacterium]
MQKHLLLCILVIVTLSTQALGEGPEPTAMEILDSAWQYYRGDTSRVEVEMTIHRPDWERTMTILAWTRGMEESIFRIVAPPKDQGNGTLKKGTEMWTYNPKVDRIIKLPPSLMSQSWMGSDFSNNDLSKANSILKDYTHEIVGTEKNEGHEVYVIKAVAKTDAPVVWGMQMLKIRDDHIILQQSFLDENGVLVKEMTSENIEPVGGRLFPSIWYMRKAEAKGEYTRLHYLKAEFDVPVPDSYFTVSYLRSAREF